MNETMDGARDDYARILAAELEEVVEELHAIDPVDLVSFIRFGSFAAIEDLLQSSAELFFKEGTLTFGWTAGVELAWDERPKVTLGLEFHHRAVSIFFNVSLQSFCMKLDIAGLRFEPFVEPGDRLRCLSEAIADARLPKRIPPLQPVAIGPAP